MLARYILHYNISVCQSVRLFMRLSPRFVCKLCTRIATCIGEHAACNFKCLVDNEGLSNVIGCHIHCKSGNISKTVQYNVVVVVVVVAAAAAAAAAAATTAVVIVTFFNKTLTIAKQRCCYKSLIASGIMSIPMTLSEL